jgi:hypothetical protein
MAWALENRPAGRPPAPVDEEKEEFRRRIEELEKKTVSSGEDDRGEGSAFGVR